MNLNSDTTTNLGKILNFEYLCNMPRLSREERLIALGMIQVNRRYSEVARHFSCTGRTIRNLVESNAEMEDDRPRPGKERVTTPEND